MIELTILFCILAVFMLGYVIGWIRGQKAMMPIIKDYKTAIASYREQIKNWHATVEDLTGGKV